MSAPVPDIALLARWLHSWVQPSGALHGVHTDPVSGENSFRAGGFSQGHSDLAAPILPALALALKDRPSKPGAELLCRMVDFQLGHPDSSLGLAALSQTAYLAPEVLGVERLNSIQEGIRRQLAVEDAPPDEHTLCHELYLRQWARLEFQTLDGELSDEDIRRNLEFLVDSFHVYGVPDMESEGAFVSLKDPLFLEPAQRYGGMIFALVEAANRYEERLYLEAAQALAKHVVRSSWTDKNGQRRLHRHWIQRDEAWSKANQPMLIGGAGLTLAGLQHLNHVAPDKETEAFLSAMDSTYEFYQHPSGFFVPASGWGGETDIMPSTAWQSHDLFYLLLRHGTPEDFWERLFQPHPGVVVLLGTNLIWQETAEHWAVCGYATQRGVELAGAKSQESFSTGSGELPEQPVFARTNDGVVQVSGRDDVWVLEG